MRINRGIGNLVEPGQRQNSCFLTKGFHELLLLFMYVFDAPGQNFALLAVENQSVLVGCSQAFEPQFEQHAASTEVPALHYKPLDRHLASAHILSAGRAYCQDLYQDSQAGYLSAPALS